MRAAAIAGLALLLAACGGEDEMVDMGTGTVKINFTVPNGVRQSPNLVDTLDGHIYGSIFKSAEVTIGGPIMGAESVADVEVLDVDLTMDDVSAAAWTSPELPPDRYIFLGFYDIDGNGAMTKDPEAGDPVTLPGMDARFDVTAGEEKPWLVSFDLIFN